MTTKEYLKQMIDIDIKISNLQFQYNQKQTQELADRLKDMQVLQATIEDQINSLRDNKLSTLLAYRYISQLTWNDVTRVMYETNVDYVKRTLHSRALKLFNDTYHVEQ